MQYLQKSQLYLINIGTQSFDDLLLKQMSRYEKFGDSKSLITKTDKISGILPITSIDLIYNLPNQTKIMLKKDIQIAKALGVEQRVTYPLINTSLNKNLTNKFKKDNNEFLYNLIQKELKSYYSNNMWSFSKNYIKMSNEYISNHNEYVGLGSGAFSYLDGNLFINAFNLKKYQDLLYSKQDTIIAKSKFTNKDMIQYYILCKLFSGEFNINKFNKNFNTRIEHILAKELNILKFFNIIYIENNIMKLTKRGKYILTIMMANFYSQMDKVRALFKNKSYLFD